MGSIERLVLRKKFTSQIVSIFHLLMENLAKAVVRWDVTLLWDVASMLVLWEWLETPPGSLLVVSALNAIL